LHLKLRLPLAFSCGSNRPVMVTKYLNKNNKGFLQCHLTSKAAKYVRVLRVRENEGAADGRRIIPEEPFSNALSQEDWQQETKSNANCLKAGPRSHRGHGPL